MNHDQAAAIVADLERAVLCADPETVRRAFDALAFLDGHAVAQRARAVLDEAADAALADGGSDDAERLHRATMDLFRGAAFEYLEAKAPEIDPSVEHDISTWIEGNAAALASANLKILEGALPADGPEAHRALIDLHRSIDFAACEAQQCRVLQTAWAAIEDAIRARLSARAGAR